MSYTGKPDGQQVAGCILYILASSFVVGFLAINAAMGDCPTDENCLSETTRLLMFPCSLVVAILGGIVLLRLTTRDKE